MRQNVHLDIIFIVYYLDLTDFTYSMPALQQHNNKILRLSGGLSRVSHRMSLTADTVRGSLYCILGKVQ